MNIYVSFLNIIHIDYLTLKFIILQIFCYIFAPSIVTNNALNLGIMVNQKLISLKIDSDLIDSMDQFCVSQGVKRNRFINDLIRSQLCNLSTYAISRLIANCQPDLLPLWYKSEYNLDF